MNQTLIKLIKQIFEHASSGINTFFRHWGFSIKYIFHKFRIQNLWKMLIINLKNYFKGLSLWDVFKFIFFFFLISLFIFLQFYLYFALLYEFIPTYSTRSPEVFLKSVAMDMVIIMTTMTVGIYFNKLLSVLFFILFLTLFLPPHKRVKIQPLLIVLIIICGILIEITCFLSLYMLVSYVPFLTEISKFNDLFLTFTYYFKSLNLYLLIFGLFFFWSLIWEENDQIHRFKFTWIGCFSQSYLLYIGIQCLLSCFDVAKSQIFFCKLFLKLFVLVNLEIILLVAIPLVFGLVIWHVFFERLRWFSVLLRLFCNFLGMLGVCYLYIKMCEFNNSVILYNQQPIILTSKFIIEACFNESLLILPLFVSVINYFLGNYIYWLGIYLIYWILRLFCNFWKSDDEFHFLQFSKFFKNGLEFIFILFGCIWLSELNIYNEMLYMVEVIINDCLLSPGLNSMIATVEILGHARHEIGVSLLAFLFASYFWYGVIGGIVVQFLLIWGYFCTNYKQKKMKKSGKIEPWRKWIQ